MTRDRLLWPAIIASSTFAVALANVTDIGPPVQEMIALWFVLVCPGMAWVRFLPEVDVLTELSLAIGLSLALAAITSVSFLYAGAWSAAAILAVLIALSLVGAALQVLKPRRPSPAPLEQR